MKSRTILSLSSYLLASMLTGCAGGFGGGVSAADSAAIDKLPGDRLIVPGVRVGPISLWTSIDDAILILGQPGAKNPQRMCRGNDCYDFIKYYWPQYGLLLYYSKSDPRAQIDEIAVLAGAQWHTAQGVTVDAPFKQDLGRINESVDIRYRSFCNDDGCAAFDGDGLWIRANDRDSALTDLIVYDPDWNGNIPMGNFPPRNSRAMTHT